MSLNIGEAIENGLDRTFKRNAVILMGIISVLSLISQVVGDSLTKKMIEQGAYGSLPNSELMASNAPLALNLPVPASGALLLIFSLLSTVVTIGMVRVFVSDEERKIPTEFFTDRILWTIANLVVGSIVFSIVLGLGFIALVIPFFFLLSALYFWNFYIIDEGQNFYEAMKSSWRDTKDNRIRVLGLLLIVFVGSTAFLLVTAGILGIIGTLVSGPALSSVLGIIPSAIVTVFSVATFTQAYKQLK